MPRKPRDKMLEVPNKQEVYDFTVGALTKLLASDDLKTVIRGIVKEELAAQPDKPMSAAEIKAVQAPSLLWTPRDMEAL